MKILALLVWAGCSSFPVNHWLFLLGFFFAGNGEKQLRTLQIIDFSCWFRSLGCPDITHFFKMGKWMSMFIVAMLHWHYSFSQFDDCGKKNSKKHDFLNLSFSVPSWNGTQNRWLLWSLIHGVKKKKKSRACHQSRKPWVPISEVSAIWPSLLQFCLCHLPLSIYFKLTPSTLQR